MLEEMFRIHMTYFLSSEIITAFGFPMTAYKVGNRARFGYSNPTEWGYAWQAWIAAAERGVITRAQAVDRLEQALRVLDALQRDPHQSYQGFPYPFYKMTDSEGNDLIAPYRDPDPHIPSGDNALLYASLVIIEGWARRQGDEELETLAHQIRTRMNFRIFLRQGTYALFLAHTLNADRGTLSTSNWDIFADEGGVVAWIAFLSGSVTPAEYLWLTESQHHRSASWTSCEGETFTVREAAWFNAMFPWAVRSLAGFPIGEFDSPPEIANPFSKESFVPAVQAHLAYGDCLGVDHPAFSDAMSQAERGRGLVGWIQGWYIPPNLQDYDWGRPHHAVPHALFVPFNALPDLPQPVKERLIAEILELKVDKAGYYHDSGLYPFGFEVIANPYKDDLDYQGADDGRGVFETLSHAYTVLSLFNALQLSDGGPTFVSFASEVPDYLEQLRMALRLVYPADQVEAWPSLHQLVDAAEEEATVVLGRGGYPGDVEIRESLVLSGEDRDRVLIVGDIKIKDAKEVVIRNLTVSGGEICVETEGYVTVDQVTARWGAGWGMGWRQFCPCDRQLLFRCPGGRSRWRGFSQTFA